MNLPAAQDKPALQTQVPLSFLAGDLTAEGTLLSSSSVVIEGRIDGFVCAARLTIGEKGFVHGNLRGCASQFPKSVLLQRLGVRTGL